MSDQFDLLDMYPIAPGSKRTDTSREAGRRIAGHASAMRGKVLNAFIASHPNGMTADEVGKAVGEGPFTVRPRCSELRALGLIEETDERRTNASRHTAVVWRATSQALAGS